VADRELVSVIIPARNAAATIEAQLEALRQQTYPGPWEIVIVDNGSTDGTERLVRAWQKRLPQLRLANAPQARGVNYARNIGCRSSRGALLLFCDADDIVAANWVAAMVEGLQDYDAVGGQLERVSLNNPVAVAARPPKWTSTLPDAFSFLPYAFAANCGVRKKVWLALNGFDPGYPYGSDDVEFFWRVQLAGYKVGFIPDAVVHYRLRTTIPSMARQYYHYGKSHTQLYRDFAAYGMPPSRFKESWKEWRWLATHSFDLCRSQTARGIWLTKLALRLGRIIGSIRNRTLYL
jgi:glycosyltransferase involved in cell wall biosynthesis